MVVTMLVVLAVVLLLDPRDDSAGADEPEIPTPPSTVKTTPPPAREAKPKREAQVPRPRVVSKSPSLPAPKPHRQSPAAAPGEEALPGTKEGQRKWLTDVQTQLRDLRKRRGTLLRVLQNAEGKPPEETARRKEELRQMMYRITAAHKLRGRLLEALAVGAPPLPQPP